MFPPPPPPLSLSLSRLQRLELLAAKFDAKATKVEAWAAGKDEALVVTEDIDNSNLAEIMVRVSGQRIRTSSLGPYNQDT